MSLARWQNTIVDGAGNVVASPQVEVRAETAGAPLARLYTDRAGTVPAANPIAGDANGYVYFHVTGGAYRITATKGAFSRTWRYVGIGRNSESDLAGLRPQGAWAADFSYSSSDYIRHNDRTFVSLVDENLGNAPPDAPADTAFWMWVPLGENAELAIEAREEAEAQADYAEEWAQSSSPISVPAGGDGTTDKSAKTWAGESATSAAEAAADRTAVGAALETASALVGSGAADWTSIGGELRSNKDELVDLGRSVGRFGALHDNSTNDASAVQETVDIGSGRVLFPDGTYRMVPGATSPFTLGNTTANVYRAVALTQSDMHFSGDGAVLHAVSRPSVVSADIQPVFSTDKNMTVGAIQNLTFEGVAFDPANDADLANSNQRFGYFVGVNGLRFLDTIAHSSGNRRGYFTHIQNSKNVQMHGHRHNKVTGGVNIRYVKNFVLTNFIFEDFSEAIDLDGTSDRVIIRSGVFESTSRLNQCIDINSQIDASIGDFSVYNVGNIATINYKTTTPPDYAAYIANDPVTSFSVGKRIILSGITGSAIGSDTNPSFYVGWDWSAGAHAGAGPVQDITLRDIDLDDAGFLYVREARNLRLENITLRGALSASGFAAVDMRSVATTDDELAYSDLDVQIHGLRIEGAQRGGLKIAAPSRAVVNGLIARSNNTLGGTDLDLRLSDLEKRAARVIIDNCDIEGGVTISGDSTAHAAWVASTAYTIGKIVTNGGKRYICTVAGTSASSGGPTGTSNSITDGTVTWRYIDRPYSIMWGPNNRLKGLLTLTGDAHKYIHGRSVTAVIGAMAATGTVTRALFTATRRCYIPRANYATRTAVAANASNYRTLQMAAVRSGVGGSIQQIDTSTVGLTTTAARDAEFAVSEANSYLEPGDMLYLASASVGTGVAFADLAVTFEVLEY